MLLTLHSANLFGQMNTATLSGTVKDSSGALVPEATVTVIMDATAITRTVQTNGSGLFTVPLLQPGTYSATISKAGFASARQPNIVLEVNQLASLDFTLVVGAVGETLTVSGATPVLSTQTAGLGTVIEDKEIQDLPLNGRQFIQLLQLAPGTVPVSVSQGNVPALGGGGSSITPSINGQTGRSNLFYIDGIYATDPFFSSTSLSPQIDAIQEFQEQTHTDQAQFGQSTGGTINLATKSGTNKFHGSAYEFFRNDALEATPYFTKTKGVYKQNQYGGTLGGPIVKNKLFFFGYYDGYRQTSAGNRIITIPSTAELGGDFSALLPKTIIYDPTTYNPATQQTQPFAKNIIPADRINQGSLSLLKAYYPSAAVAAPNNYINTQNNTTNQDQYSVRVDYNISQRDLLFARWTINEETGSSPNDLPSNPFLSTFNGNNSGINWVHTFSPTLVSQATIGYNSAYAASAFAQPNSGSVFAAAGLGAGFTQFPGGVSVVQIPGIHPSGYGNLYAYFGPTGPERIGQFSGSINKQAGKHALIFGGAYYITEILNSGAENDISFNQQATANPCGSGSGGNCNSAGGDSIASLLLGLPNYANRQVGNNSVTLRSHIVGVYAQDSWKIYPNLTVNYGLRWDYTSPVSDDHNRLSGFDIHTGNWFIVKGNVDTPAGTLPAGVVTLNRNSITKPDYKNVSPRLGFSYQVLPETVLSAGAGVSFDNWSGALQAAQNARGSWPTGSGQGFGGLNNPGSSVVTIQNPFGSTPLINPASPFPGGGGFLDTDFKDAYSWQWNLQLQQQLGRSGVFKLAYVGSSTSRAGIQVPFNVSTTLGPTVVRPFPINPTGFVVIQSVGHMNYNALQAQYTKRYSSGVSVNTAFTWSKNINVGCADFWEGCNIQNPYDLKSNRSVDDVDVPVVFTLGALYELPFGKNKALATSGVKSKLFGGWQTNGIVTARGGTPFSPSINYDNANSDGGSHRPNVIGPTNGPKTLNEYFNTAAFVAPARYTYGNAGRNSLRGPGFTNVDLSLFRNFEFFERANLQFRVESFNLLNHPNFGNPDSTLEDANFGKITSLNSSSPASRTLQLAGTFRF